MFNNETGKHEKLNDEWNGIWIRNTETGAISIIVKNSDEVIGELNDDDTLIVNTNWNADSRHLSIYLEEVGYEIIPNTLKRFAEETGYYVA